MEKKDIKDYLHLYVGCEVYGTYNDGSGSRGILTGVTNGGYECEIQFYLEDGINVEEEPTFNESKEVKLILRPLSSMTEEEALHVAWFNMDSEKHLDKDARISKDEINANVVYNDGGLLVDEDAAVVIDLTCRCFEGQVCIRNNGDIEVWNDSGEKLPIERQSENVRYLLSKGFDLFNLIPEGLAIDSTLKPV